MSKKKPKSLDRRIQKTRKVLLESLISLMLEKDYSTISVTDITEKANVGRSTFYAHFEDKEQLLFSGNHAFMEGMMNLSNGNIQHGAPSIYFQLFSHAAENRRLTTVMFGKSSGYLMLERAKDILRNYFQKKITILDSKKIQLYSESYASAIMGLLINWMEQGSPFSIEFMEDKCLSIEKLFIILDEDCGEQNK